MAEYIEQEYAADAVMDVYYDTPSINLSYECIGEACVGYHAGICLRAHEALKEVKEDGKITYNRRICETSV